MPQETNLNVAPYFDDFDPRNNYYKVLFKPAYPIQARELNNLQSILQDQIEKMGTNIFKEGTVVIPGSTNYNPNFHAVQIQPQFLGIPVSVYLEQLLGKKITGAESGITAQVITYITDTESSKGNYTLYVNYLNSSTSDDSTETFSDNEILQVEEAISYATTFIGAGEGFANTIVDDATADGSAFVVSEGVYFIRGYFVTVPSQLVILDQYGTTPNYRIGLKIREELISSDTDPLLTDNASGFNNFAAPGADRLSITATLVKRNLDSYDEENFIQLAEVQNGLLRRKSDDTKFNLLGDEFAKRTYEESGNYYIKEFVTTVRESLNDQKGNRGVYDLGQVTRQGNTPTDDLMVYKVSPGKAYVKGYEIEVRSPSLIDVEKPRTTRLLENQAVNFAFGPTFEVNNVNGSPLVGFNTSTVLSLRDQRVGGIATESPGSEIGLARVYDFVLESGSYNTNTPQDNLWDLTLFDVQTFTDIDVNIGITLNASNSVHIEGESSGATAFLRYDVNAGTALTAYSKQGDFIFGERIKFNGVLDNSRFIININNHTISDVKSVFVDAVGAGNTFSADLVQHEGIAIGIASITGRDATGVSTITSPVLNTTGFVGIVSTGNLLRYTLPENNDPTLVRITGINGSDVTVVGVTTVAGVCEGSPPTSNASLTDLTTTISRLQGSTGTGNDSSSDSLFSALAKENVRSVNLQNSNLTIRDNFDVEINSDGESQVLQVSDAENEIFLSFDEERYSLLRSDGITEPLTADRFIFTAGSTRLQLKGLSAADPNAKLIATIRKSNVKNKVKLKSNNNIIINKSTNSASGIGTGTLNDGLGYGSYPFGTRVQDSTISLNVPDVVDIYGIYESDGVTDPQSPNATLSSLNGPSSNTNDLIIGEIITGSTSGSKARLIEKLTANSIGYVYLNDIVFEPGESVSFADSKIEGNISNINIGSRNITRNYSLAKGQKSSFYDFSRIIRKGNFPAPSRKLKVYFCSAYYESSDTGDITTVNSYDSFNYTDDISIVSKRRVSDIIDARPRVTSYNTTAGTRSPLEFFGRNFDGGQHSSKNVIASDESMTVSYDYYLARADRIYVDKFGSFSVKYGAPDDVPQLPAPVTDGLNIANIFMPAYLYNVKDARLNFIDHKRYQMIDIAKIEQRVKNLEYYTSLNLLEQSTLNTFVPDTNGLNRFKSGIFVDNFTTRVPQEDSIGIRNSIDTKKKILRPAHYTTSFNLQLGIGNSIFGTGIRRTGNMLTLDYQDTNWLEQPFATRVENVTPFLVNFYGGSIELEPSVDVWIDTNQLEVRDVLQEGAFSSIASLINAEVETAEDGSRVGVAPVVWNSWETVGAQLDVTLSQQTQSLNAATNSGNFGTQQQILSSQGVNNNRINANRTTVESITLEGSVSLEQTRTGVQQTLNEVINTESLGDRVVSREIIHFMRSRNIKFTAKRLKPFTRMFSFFDAVDVNRFIVPKLIEINMTSGIFQVGETITGVMQSSLDAEETSSAGSAAITFRTCVANHKFGAFDEPSDVFDSNPYDRINSIATAYTESSTILNVDTDSLADETQSEFSGYIQQGMILRGNTSGAEAVVSRVALITDRIGTLIGSFRVPDSSNAANPIFETGRSNFKLTSSSTNSNISGLVSSSAEETFYSQGDVDNTQEVTLSLRNSRIETVDIDPQTRIVAGEADETSIIQDINVVRTPPQAPRVRRGDPLAQTFFVDDITGVYLSRVELFFQSKDSDLPVTVQLRETRLGTPTDIIVPFSTITLEPDQVSISEDGTAPTSFIFPSPVYLNPQTEYALVVLSDVTSYNVWISRFGEADVTTLAQEAGQILVTEQPLLGSLFKSQNARVWTPSQYEDLKFVAYRCNFTSNGVVQFFNPNLPTDLEKITKNGVSVKSRSMSVGIGTTIDNTGNSAGNNFISGTDISQVGSNFRGTVVGLAGSAIGDISIVNAGAGYTPSSGQFTHIGVSLTTITGNGVDAKADITVNGGVAIAATISTGGNGYNVADVVAPVHGNLVGLGNIGRDMKFSIQQLEGFNEIDVTNVQGELLYGATNYLRFTTQTGITSDINTGIGGSVTPIANARVNAIDDGLHMKVFQRNHGMYADTNRVTLQNVTSDIPATPLAAAYSRTSNDAISVGTTANMADFEGLPVSVSNPGYVKIGNEIISYTGVSGNTLTGVVGRGVDNSLATSHAVNELVFRYEFGGISLRRINKEHNLADSDVPNGIGIDFYHIKLNMAQNGIDRSATSSLYSSRYFSNDTTGGGISAKGTYNLPYSMIIPNLRTTAPSGSSLNASVRTVTETSVDGTEISFLDKGYQEVSLNEQNYFDSQRMIASSVNERTFLTALPGSKSMTMDVNMFTTDARLSPAIDLDHASVIFVSNRTNRPVVDYKSDVRVKDIPNDPNSLLYVTKNIVLENPATSLRVFIDGYVSNFNDVRLFYAVNQDLPAEECVFTPFPGVNNIDEFGKVIQPFNSDGGPDVFIPKSDIYTQLPSLNLFKEYKFSIDDLEPFNFFRIKIVGTSTNQAIVPQFRNFRVIAAV